MQNGMIRAAPRLHQTFLRRALGLAITLGVMSALTTAASGASVKGIIKLSRHLVLKTMATAPGYWLLPNDVLPILSPLVDQRMSMVVVMEGGGASNENLVPPAIKMEDLRFFPPVLPIRPKTKVKLENLDPIFHLLEPMSSNFMPVKRVGPRSSVEQSFEKPGVYHLRCTEFPHMVATIFVTESPLFTLPDASGSFTFPEVRTGTYTLRIWHQGEWIHSQPLSVMGKTTVEVELKSASK